MSPGGTIELSFALGLGIASNNIEEVYALMQGLWLAIEYNIQLLIVVGDLKIVIGKMVSNTMVVDNILASVLEKEKKEVINFTSIILFQVL